MEAPAEVPQPAETILLNHLAASPVTAAQIRALTDRDTSLSRVRDLVMQGWPMQIVDHNELHPYHQHKQELSVNVCCVLRGSRITAPPALHNQVLD